MPPLEPKSGYAKPSFKPTHRHYKGGLYEVVDYGQMEHNMRAVVLYRAENGQLWVRYKDDFDAWVEVDGEKVRRFTPLPVSKVGPGTGSAEEDADALARTGES